jgi:hypothetical protein
MTVTGDAGKRLRSAGEPLMPLIHAWPLQHLQSHFCNMFRRNAGLSRIVGLLQPFQVKQILGAFGGLLGLD